VSAGAGPRPADRGRELLGLALGLAGVIAFSLTLPMTRTAVGQLDPWLVAFARMSIAGAIAAAWLAAWRAPLPERSDLGILAASSLGIVIGFPLLSSLAMDRIAASHGAVINGALPFATALLAALLYGERQRPRFWVCAGLGSLLVIAFALRDGLAGRSALPAAGDWLMFAAVAAGALGYVTGGRLAARVGGVRAILWALVAALPLTVPVSLWLALRHPPQADALAWGAFAYLTLVSQIAGFFAWYNGLALGGIGRVGQVQLLQVFFTIGFAALLFGESVPAATWLFALAVIATIVVGRGAAAATGSRPPSAPPR